MTMPRHFGPVVRALMVCVVAGATALALGQPPRPRPGRPFPLPSDPPAGEAADAVTLPLDRDAKSRLQAAQEYAQKEEWLIATRLLQDLLDNDANEDLYVEVGEPRPDGGTATKRACVRVEADRQLGELPPAGLAFYVRRYGKEAADRLKEARAKSDPEILAEVCKRYFHTPAGAEAMLLRGNYHLGRGEYELAALCYERLLARRGGPPQADPQLLFRALLAHQRSLTAHGSQNRTDEDTRRTGARSAELWKKLSDQLGPGGSLSIGPVTVTLDQARQELDRPLAAVQAHALGAWPLVGGTPSRTGKGEGGIAFLDEQRFPRHSLIDVPRGEDVNNAVPGNAKADATASEWIRTTLDEVLRAQEEKHLAVIPAFTPVAAPGKLIFRTYDGVYALPLRGDPVQKLQAGHVWRMQTADYALHKLIRAGGSISVKDTWWRDIYAKNGPRGVLYENSLVGTLSLDGQRIYFVDDLGLPPPVTMNAGAFPGAAPPAANLSAVSEAVNFNVLKALDLTTGALVWELGRPIKPIQPEQQKEGSVAELFDCYFLGPPLPLNGKLYVLSERQKELRLLCLDPTRLVMVPAKSEKDEDFSPKVPALCWMRRLGSPNVPLPNDSLRRTHAAHVAYADGMLVVPTNAGVIYGIDLLDHSLAWAHTYRTGPPPSEMFGGFPPGQMQMRMMQRGMIVGMGGQVASSLLAQERWRSTPPVVANGRVVFTAPDSNSIRVLRLRDGAKLWEEPRAPDDLYLAGVYDGRIIIVSKNGVRALPLGDAAPTRPLWRLEHQTGMPSGVGVASGNFYYLPTRNGPGTPEPEIVAIDLTTGQVRGRSKSRDKQAPGNLVLAEGDVFSQDAQYLTGYPQLETKIAEMNRRLEKNPHDPLGLFERGTLHLDQGSYLAAVNDLHACLAQGPESPLVARTKEKLYETLTELLQNDFPAGEPFLAEYEQLCKIDVPANVSEKERQQLQEEQLHRRANRLSLLGEGRKKQAQKAQGAEQSRLLLEAFRAYEEFGLLTGNHKLVSVRDEPTTLARPDVWARGRIAALIAEASPAARRPLEELIAQKFERLKSSGDLTALRGFVSVFGESSQIGRQARLALAERLLKSDSEDDLREAELDLLQLRGGEGPPELAAQAVEQLARLCVRRGLLEDAVGYYRQLGTQYAKVVIRDGLTGAALYKSIQSDKRFLPYLETVGAAWQGRLRATVVHEPSRSYLIRFTLEPQGEPSPFLARHRLIIESNNGNNNWRLKSLDRRTGEETTIQDNLPANPFVFYRGGQPIHFAYVRGHTLILNLNHYLFAIDLAGNRELWKFNLFDPFGKRRSVPAQPVQEIPDADGGLRLIYQDGWTQRVGQVCVIEANYVCVQTAEGLMALDPLRGTVLWNRDNVSSRAAVFGDDKHVYIVEADSNGKWTKTQAVRAADGASVTVPDFLHAFDLKKRQRILGRFLLLFEDNPKGVALRLYDVHTGTDAWRQDFPPKTLLLRCDEPDLTGAVTPAGRVTIYDLRARTTVYEGKIEHEHVADAVEAHLLADRDHFFVVLNHSTNRRVQFVPSAGNGLRSLQLNGVLYALPRSANQQLWFAELDNQAIMLEQFSDLPVVVCAAFQQVRNAKNPGLLDRSGVAVVGLDKTTGKYVLNQKSLSYNGQQFQSVNADPRQGVIELVRGDLKIRLAPATR